MAAESPPTAKDLAQLALRLNTAPRFGEIYQHYKGGYYSVVCVSVKEDTLERLVTYHDNRRGGLWTATEANFQKMVEVTNQGKAQQVRRFARVLQ